MLNSLSHLHFENSIVFLDQFISTHCMSSSSQTIQSPKHVYKWFGDRLILRGSHAQTFPLWYCMLFWFEGLIKWHLSFPAWVQQMESKIAPLCIRLEDVIVSFLLHNKQAPKTQWLMTKDKKKNHLLFYLMDLCTRAALLQAAGWAYLCSVCLWCWDQDMLFSWQVA